MYSCTACGIRDFCSDSEAASDQFHECPLRELPEKYRLTQAQLEMLASMPIVNLYAVAEGELRDTQAAPPQRRQALAPVVSCYPAPPQLVDGQTESAYRDDLRSTPRYHLHPELVEEREASDGDTEVRFRNSGGGRYV
jgi:hypothetical protein